MLRLAREGRGFRGPIFGAALMECDFVAYPVDTWQAATQARAPLFSQQWASSQAQGAGGAMTQPSQVGLRA